MRRRDPWLSATLQAQLRARRTLVIGGALVALALLLTQVPLFDVLGFEFAFAMAIAGSVAGADLGAAYLRRWRAVDRSALDVTAPPLAVVLRIVGGAVALSLLLLVPPLVIIALDALRVRTCDWSFGALCYLLMPGISAALAATLGVLCALAVPARRRVLGLALPHLVLLGSVGVALLRFYGAPAVFSYNPFGGYFPGNLYDERVELAAPFYWARTFHLAVALAAVGTAAFFVDLRDLTLRLVPRPRGLRRLPLALALCGGALAALLWGRSGALGFAVSAEDMSAALPRRFETQHFVIHYPPGGAIERDILFIAEDHEFRLAQVARTLGVAPPDKIHSFYFDSADQKHRLMGARNVYMAKPWRKEIYLNHADFPHQVLRHEIAHVVAGEFGDPIFHVSARRVLGVPAFFNVGLIEGIAVAADWPDHFTRALTPHQSVKAMLELGFVPPIERLLSTGFFEFSSARSYTASGSFVRFLLDRYGIERLQRFYESGGDFSAAYDDPAVDIFAAWRRMIEATQLPDGAAEVVRERFRRGGIFDRPCPHAIARARTEARRLEGEGKTGEAIELVRGICRDAPGEPSYELELADLLARGGFVDEATRRYLALADDADRQSSTVRVNALVRAAGLAVRAGDDARAGELLARAAKLPVDDDLARQVVALLRVLDETGPARAPLRAYFWGDPLGTPSDPALGLARAAEAALLDPGDGFAHYLVGRQLRGRGDPEATTRALVRALDSGDLGVLVTREATRLLAEAAYLAGDYAVVERAASVLTADDQPRVTRLYGYDWLERLAWKRTGSVPAPALGPPTTPATPP